MQDIANTEELSNNKNMNNKGGPRNETNSIKTKMLSNQHRNKENR